MAHKKKKKKVSLKNTVSKGQKHHKTGELPSIESGVKLLQRGLLQLTSGLEAPREIFFCETEKDLKRLNQDQSICPKLELSHFKGKSHEEVFLPSGVKAWVVYTPSLDRRLETQGHAEQFSSSDEVFRDLAGEIWEKTQAKAMRVHCFGASKKQIGSFLMGLELAHYQFSKIFKGNEPRLDIEVLTGARSGSLSSSDLKNIEGQLVDARSMNLARHLVNLPANVLNPQSYETLLRKTFEPLKNWKIEVLDEKQLKAQGRHLLWAVGKSATNGPRLIRLVYRGAAKTKKATAIVGKGITFDSGGLNIKPGSGMGLMKKDMGGSACVFGVAHGVSIKKPKLNLDFYFCLAENAISREAMRPGDIYFSKSGKSVEITNTDAEGRLALVDGIELALEHEPQRLIDVATLTGAIKAGLGAEVAGLFSNSDQLAAQVLKSSQKTGDWCWRMPVFQKYRGQLQSTPADLVNSASGFGGAVTAALFIESFVQGTPWAHLDIYAWKDSPQGPLRESGGSGQGVLLLLDLLNR